MSSTHTQSHSRWRPSCRAAPLPGLQPASAPLCEALRCRQVANNTLMDAEASSVGQSTVRRGPSPPPDRPPPLPLDPAQARPAALPRRPAARALQPVSARAAATKQAYICIDCGYIYDGSEGPFDKLPATGAGHGASVWRGRLLASVRSVQHDRHIAYSPTAEADPGQEGSCKRTRSTACRPAAPSSPAPLPPSAAAPSATRPSAASSPMLAPPFATTRRA